MIYKKLKRWKMKANDLYNKIVYVVGQKKEGTTVKKEEFDLEQNGFKSIIDKIENDGLFQKGVWLLAGGYIFMGLTYDGRIFIENDDKKEYYKIEKTEINYHHNVNVGGNNHGNIITGNHNTIVSEFDKRFDELIHTINSSNLQSKEIIIQDLENNKNNGILLKKSLGAVLTKGAEFGSIVSAVSALLSL